MGYTEFQEGYSLRRIIRDYTGGWARTGNDGVTYGSRCISKCVRGDRRHHVRLWMLLQEYAKYPDDDPERPGQTVYEPAVIGLMLLDCQRRCWGYRDMSESCGPYEYDCPLSYLKIAPETNRKWREQVRIWHKEHPRQPPRYRTETTYEDGRRWTVKRRIYRDDPEY